LWPFLFSFSELPQQIFVRWTRIFFAVPPRGFGFRFRYGMAQSCYMMTGEAQQKWTVKN
jgi:hypothetical protein